MNHLKYFRHIDSFILHNHFRRSCSCCSHYIPHCAGDLRLRDGAAKWRVQWHAVRAWLTELCLAPEHSVDVCWAPTMCLEVEYIHEPDEQPCPQGRYILIWRQTMIKISPFSWPYVAVLPTKEALLPLEVRTFMNTLPTVPKYWSQTPKNITLTQGAYQNADSCSPDLHCV